MAGFLEKPFDFNALLRAARAATRTTVVHVETDPLVRRALLRDAPRIRAALVVAPDRPTTAKTRFIAGDQFTLADCTLYCSIEFAGWSDIGIPADCKNLQRWWKEVSDRPSAKA